MSGEWQTVDSLTPTSKNKRKKLKHPGDGNKTIDDTEISSYISKKMKWSSVVAEQSFSKSSVGEDSKLSSVCEDSKLSKKKNKKKKVKTFLAAENSSLYKAQQYDQQDDSTEREKKKMKKRKEQISSVNEELIQDEDQQGDSLTSPKKEKIKKIVIYDDLEYHQEEPHPNQVSSTGESRKSSKKSTLTVREECKEKDKFLSLTLVNESKRKGSHQENYVGRDGLSESLTVTKNRKKKQLRLTINPRILGFSQTEDSHLNQERNEKSLGESKKKKKKLLALGGIGREAANAILQDGTSSAVKESKRHGSPLTTVKSSQPSVSNSTRKKRKRTFSSREEVVDPSVSANNLSSLGKKRNSKERKEDENISFISHRTKPTVARTEGIEYHEDVSGANRTSKIKDSDVEQDRNGEEVHSCNVMEKEQRESVRVEEKPFDCPDDAVGKTEQKLESSVHQKDASLNSQDGANKDKDTTVVKSPSAQKKSPKMIHDPIKEFLSQSLWNGYSEETGDNRRNMLSTSRFSVSLIEPKSGVPPNTSNPTADTPRCGSKESKRKLIEDLRRQMSPQKKNESSDMKPSINHLLERIITIDSESEPIRHNVDNSDSDSGESLESPLRDNEFVKSKPCDGKKDASEVSRLNISAQFATNQKCEQSHEEDASCIHMQSLEKGAECQICSKKFLRTMNLKRHSVTHTPISERSFTCEVCDKEYLTRRSYIVHKETHTTKSFKCEECDQTFFHRSHLTVHSAVAHIHSFVNCDLCDKVFPSVKAFNGHLSKHVVKKHVCSVCFKTFSYLSNLDQHMIFHEHKEEHKETTRKFRCEICPKVYKSRQNLHDHLRRRHDKAWECPACDKTFYLPKQLEKHMIIHSEYRPYECLLCEKTFKRYTDLQHHKWYHRQTEIREREKRTLTPVAAKFVELKNKVPKDVLMKLLEDVSNGVAVSDTQENLKSPDGKNNTAANISKRKTKKEHYRCSNCRKVYSGFDKLLCTRCLNKKSKLSLSRR